MRLARVPSSLAVLLLAAGAVAFAGCGADDWREELRVGAAVSLRELLERTAPAFEARRPGAQLVFGFGASSAIARQIEAGADYDVFLSADAPTLGRVLGALDPAFVRPGFVANRLVVVSSVTGEPLEELSGLRATQGRIALAGPSVPVGRYARSLLRTNGLLEPLAPRIVNAEHAHAALALVESGAAAFGLVYETDARRARRARVVWRGKSPADARAVYVAAAIVERGGGAHRSGRRRGDGTAGPESEGPGPSLSARQAYVEWLASPEFRDAARALGFTTP